MTQFTLSWRSLDPTRNRARWYALTVARDLWGNLTVIKRWGRLHGARHERVEWFVEMDELRHIIQATHQNRLRHGYTLIQGRDVLGAWSAR